MKRVSTLLSTLGLLAVLAPAAALAQPFGPFMTLSGAPNQGYLEIPHSAALNPPGPLTIEAWVLISSLTPTEQCGSLVGQDYDHAWWIGYCKPGILRSVLRGASSVLEGGTIPTHDWTHIAVVFDGATRKHYINGELVASTPETGPLPTSNVPLRIGGDFSFNVSPHAAIDEVRFWNVARSQAQIRCSLNHFLPSTDSTADQCTGAQDQNGLVAAWGLNVNGHDGTANHHDGTVVGTGVTFVLPAPGFGCSASTPTELCLSGRYALAARFRTGPPGSIELIAHTVPVANVGSGLFWFFGPDNWEITVKQINGCGLNHRNWLFITDGTNVFYRLTVIDGVLGTVKQYFNYPGAIDLPVLDTRAYANCPP